MEKKYYTAERNVQIVIALLKAHGIRRVIASPGTTNMTFIGSIQQDPFFQIWSCVDERSAAYMACGMAAETDEPVVLSCTGATASRNYMPGLTEAYYRKLPVLAITSHRGDSKIGHLLDQQIDRRSIPNDIAMEHVTVPMAKTRQEERYCEIEANKAMLALKLNGGGPVHINMFTEYNQDFSVKELPMAHAIFRYACYDEFPQLPRVRKIGVYIGAHHDFTKEETEAIDAFCSSNDAIVLSDPTSGYRGKYEINFHIVCNQTNYRCPFSCLDLLVHIGEVSAPYHITAKEVWRVSEDGALRDSFGTLTKVFMMREVDFFRHYSKERGGQTAFWEQCKQEESLALSKVPELPFGNIWIAQHTICQLPEGSELHLGIYNSLRSWSYFELPKGVMGKCNVGGFGIDGGVSTLIGASLANPDKLFFGIFGDLAFFYDMNSLGNRHIAKNIRVMLINNARGTEFRLYTHPCSRFGEEADLYMAAAGHFGNKSPLLVKHYAEDMGYRYLSASNKEEFMSALPEFINPELTDHSVIFEVFTNSKDESDALKLMNHILTGTKDLIHNKLRNVIKDVTGEASIDVIKKILKK